MSLTEFIIFGIYMSITNSQGKFCVSYTNNEVPEGYCQLNVQTKYSLFNKKENKEQLTIQTCVNLVVVIFTVIGIHLIRRHIRIVKDQLNQFLLSASDYTVQVSNFKAPY